MKASRARSLPDRDAHCGEIRTITLGRSAARHQILAFMGFLACIEPFEVQRFQVLCEEWDAQITVVDAPGYGYGGGRLAPAERRALRRGDFAAVARRMARAAQRDHPPLGQGPVTVVGYSMGASLACAAAAQVALLRVTTLMLVEPVAMRRWNIPQLIQMVRSEDAALQPYLDDNAAWVNAVLPVQRRNEGLPACSRIDLAHLGFGLSRGGMTNDLLQAGATQNIAVHIVHGDCSRLCTITDVAKLAATCRRAGMSVRDVPLNGRHPMWHSLREATAIARSTRKYIGAQP
jgi:pimeloyl-ACP methyl ester carboxylesterase